MTRLLPVVRPRRTRARRRRCDAASRAGGCGQGEQVCAPRRQEASAVQVQAHAASRRLARPLTRPPVAASCCSAPRASALLGSPSRTCSWRTQRARSRIWCAQARHATSRLAHALRRRPTRPPPARTHQTGTSTCRTKVRRRASGSASRRQRPTACAWLQETTWCSPPSRFACAASTSQRLVSCGGLGRQLRFRCSSTLSSSSSSLR